MDGWPTIKMAFTRDKYTALKRWAVVQKVTLTRGYGWLQVPMIGFIAASQLKLMFPAFFNGILKFTILIVACTILLWLVGYIDKKMELLHAEQAYGTETNLRLMEMLDNTRAKNE